MGETIELDEGNLYYTDPQTDLLVYLENGNFDKFENILKNNFGRSFDINYKYQGSDNRTLLEIACSQKNKAKFVQLMLEYGANVNLLNKLYGKTPIHLAVLNSDYETLKLLVENEHIDINKADNFGHTAFQLATQQGKEDFVKLLQKHPAIEMNKIKRKNQTTINIDHKITEDREPLVRDNNDITLLDNTSDSTDQTNRNSFPTANSDSSLQDGSRSSEESLFSLLCNRNYEGFVSKANAGNVHFGASNDTSTYLQYACEFGLTRFVRALLDLKVDPNKTSTKNRKAPIVMAAYNGYYEIVKILVDTGKIAYHLVDGDNILHLMFIGVSMRENKHGDSDKVSGYENQDFYQCLEYLLNTVPNSQLDVNLLNQRDKTVLYYAILADNRDIIRLLLEKGAYIGVTNSKGEMPVKFMKAATLEYFLNEAITSKRHILRKDHRIILDYNLLVCKYLNSTTIKETKPLVAISQVSQLRPLLKHPFFIAFLDLKWYIIMNKFTLINYFFYTLFVLFLSSYLLIAYVPTTSKLEFQNRTITVSQNNTILASQNNTILASQNNSITPQNKTIHLNINVRGDKFKDTGTIFWYIVVILNTILLLREFLQFIVYSNSNKYRYIKNPENWIETALIIIIYIILFCEIDSTENRSLLAVTAIFLSWLELMLLILSHPSISVHITMFKAVAWNSLKFLMCYLILIVAFALSFYLLFKDTSPEFKDILLAIFRTGVMSTGQYEVSNNPFNNEFGIKHLFFVLFIFLIPIVLFNLLNGVAVSDIQGIRKDAELVSTVARVKLIAHMEEIISDLLTFLDGLLYYYWVLIRRQSESEAEKHNSRLKQHYYRYINLFSTLSEDGRVYISPNQANFIFIKNRISEKGQTDGSNVNFYMPKLFISTSTVEAITENLSERAGNLKKANHNEVILEVTQAIANLQDVYKNQVILLKNTSEKTEDRLQVIEQKLTDIIELLKVKL